MGTGETRHIDPQNWESLKGLWVECDGHLGILWRIQHAAKKPYLRAWIINPSDVDRSLKSGLRCSMFTPVEKVKIRADIPRAFNPDGTPPETGYEPVAPNNRFGIAATDSEVIISDNQERKTIRVPAHQATHMGMMVMAAAASTDK